MPPWVAVILKSEFRSKQAKACKQDCCGLVVGCSATCLIFSQRLLSREQLVVRPRSSSLLFRGAAICTAGDVNCLFKQGFDSVRIEEGRRLKTNRAAILFVLALQTGRSQCSADLARHVV